MIVTGLPHVMGPQLRGSRLRPDPAPHGIMVHTTGGGIVRQAQRLGRDPFAHALAAYCEPGANFPHLLIGWGGRRGIIADERVQAWGAAVELSERRQYQRGWADGHDPLALRWRAAWPQVASPLGLYPGNSPNAVYLHVELLEVRPYTEAQYRSLAEWAADVFCRYELPLDGARAAGRLVGHEDVNPIARCDKAGTWDPGALRDEPRFDWPRFLALVEEAHRA